SRAVRRELLELAGTTPLVGCQVAIERRLDTLHDRPSTSLTSRFSLAKTNHHQHAQEHDRPRERPSAAKPQAPHQAAPSFPGKKYPLLGASTTFHDTASASLHQLIHLNQRHQNRHGNEA